MSTFLTRMNSQNISAERSPWEKQFARQMFKIETDNSVKTLHQKVKLLCEKVDCVHKDINCKYLVQCV